MEYITFDEAVSECLTMFEDPTPLQRSIFRQWVGQAVEQLGPDKTNRLWTSIPVVDGVAVKPKGYIYPTGLILKNPNGDRVSYVFNGAGRDFMNRHSEGSVVVSEGIDSFSISLDENVSEMLLEYYSLPINPQGELLINSHDMSAISAFVDWSWERRSRSSIGRQRDARQVWKEERAIAKGRRKTPSMVEAKAMARSLNSMILTYRS